MTPSAILPPVRILDAQNAGCSTLSACGSPSSVWCIGSALSGDHFESGLATLWERLQYLITSFINPKPLGSNDASCRNTEHPHHHPALPSQDSPTPRRT